MTVPHVLDLAGVPRSAAEELRLPAVESIDALEQLLASTRIEDTAAAVIERHPETCDAVTCELLAHAQYAHQWHDWQALAALWRLWAADEPCNLGGWQAGRDTFEQRARDVLADELHHAGLQDRRLSDLEFPLRERTDYLDWRGRWRGLPWQALPIGISEDQALAAAENWRRGEESATDNALLEFWRGKHLIRKARATGARQRAIEALRAKVRPLEALALDYALRALIDPLNAAVEAALDS